MVKVGSLRRLWWLCQLRAVGEIGEGLPAFPLLFRPAAGATLGFCLLI
jgi:hypothetical protein